MRDAHEKTNVWSPTVIRRRISTEIGTSTEPTLVVTDAGNAYVKWPSNIQGPAALSSEWIGTSLATWLGLETFPHAIFRAAPVDAFSDSNDELLVPVFATREVKGEPWNETDSLLKLIENPQDISWLVVFDTWICNYDRFFPRIVSGDERPHRNPRNVFLSENAARGRFRLRVYDHTASEITKIDAPGETNWRANIEDSTIYGLFPQFKRYLDRQQVRLAANRLATLDHKTIESIVEAIPPEWLQNPETPMNWKEFITQRAAFVARTIEARLFPQYELDYDNPN